MASDKARELARRQKEEVKALKRAKRESADPRDWSQWRQMRETYKLTRQHDKALPWLLLGAMLGPIVLLTVAGLFIRQPILLGMLGFSIGVIAAMLLFIRRAKRAAFRRYEGQAGSGEVALSMLPKQWSSTPGITANRQLDTIHRALGPGGLILVGEGEPGRLRPMLAAEKRRHEQVAYGVEVIVIQMGEREGQVPLPKLADHIRKLPKQLSADKINEVKSRLKALDAMRPVAPIPRGPMPSMKGAHKAMRGR